MTDVNWGMIGCGNVTEKKGGAPAINKVDHSRLVAVMSRSADKAADYAKRHQVPKWYDNADALINDPIVNAIYIATPPDAHLNYTTRALKAGKPVYIEKPMGRNFRECETMNEVSRETGVPVFVAYYRRTLPHFLKLRELINQGAIGDIRCISITLLHPPYPEEKGNHAEPRWRVFPEISGGGHFHDLASHQFDFLDYVFGPILRATGVSKNQAGLYPADDVVAAVFEFESGVVGSGTWCFTIDPGQQKDETQIIGSKGSIRFSFFGSNIITVETPQGSVNYDIPLPPHVHQPLLETIVEELRGEGRCPSTGISGARANLVLDWITSQRPS